VSSHVYAGPQTEKNVVTNKCESALAQRLQSFRRDGMAVAQQEA